MLCLTGVYCKPTGLPNSTEPRLAQDLSTKLTSFQTKFNAILAVQAEHIEHEPSQPVAQQSSLVEFWIETLFFPIVSASLRQQKAHLRKLLIDLSKEDVQLNQIILRCRLGSIDGLAWFFPWSIAISPPRICLSGLWKWQRPRPRTQMSPRAVVPRSARQRLNPLKLRERDRKLQWCPRRKWNHPRRARSSSST